MRGKFRFKHLVAFVAFATIVLGVFVTNNPIKSTIFDKKIGNACTAAATRQLPADLVRKVNRERVEHDIPLLKDGSKVLASRKPDKDFEVYANVSFLPGYCGFMAGVDRRPISARAQNDPNFDWSSVKYDDEVVVTLGAMPDDMNDVPLCISDTVPRIERPSGLIVMKMACNRHYSWKEWGTGLDPVLKEQKIPA